MTRVVFLSHSGADSGAEQCTVTYAAHWPATEDAPLLLLGEHGAIERRAAAAGVEATTLEVASSAASMRRDERGVGRLLGTAWALVRHSSRVRDLLEVRSADVVVAITIKSLLFGLLAGRRARATVVWSLHDRVSSSYFASFLVPVLRYVVPRLVDGVMVNSRTTLATLRPGRRPVLVATPPIELDAREFHEPRDDLRRVVMLGRLSPWKGQDLFLTAFARVFAGTDTQAYLVGGALFGEEAYEEQLRQQVVDLGIAEQVSFVGHVDDPWAPLVDGDVLVHASRIPEPFGQVVVQGLWSRCAVVATTPGGPAEVITDGHDGLLVPCGDESALGDALARLRDDAGLRRRLAERGRERARHYDATVAAPALAAWLDALHAGRASRGTATVLAD